LSLGYSTVDTAVEAFAFCSICGYLSGEASPYRSTKTITKTAFVIVFVILPTLGRSLWVRQKQKPKPFCFCFCKFLGPGATKTKTKSVFGFTFCFRLNPRTKMLTLRLKTKKLATDASSKTNWERRRANDCLSLPHILYFDAAVYRET